MENQRCIGTEEAMLGINAVREHLEALGRGGAVAVCDVHGELVAFVRTKGCPLPSIEIAINKAYTSARQREESGSLGALARDGDFPTWHFGGLRYLGWAGGLPLIDAGETIGAIGVSGLTEEEDAEVARLGLHAILEAI